ncbi:unnamed protein product [Amoebophrya sp. A25]|nr:unnamed protein product [Amoebophrya sp. A25]|eukprot:GSA25T00015026001.1
MASSSSADEDTHITGSRPVNLTFLGVGRPGDGVLLASYVHPQYADMIQDTEETFMKILHAAKVRLAPGQRQRLMWEDSTVTIQLNHPRGDLMYGVVATTQEFPERLSYKLLSQFGAQIDERLPGNELSKYRAHHCLSDALGPMMGDLMSKFERPEEYDRINRLQEKTNSIKGLLRNNIKEVVENTERLDSLQEDAEAMEETAREYQEKSKEVKQYFWWKDTRLTVIIVVVVVLVLGYLFYSCMGGRGASSNSSQNSAPPARNTAALPDSGVAPETQTL